MRPRQLLSRARVSLAHRLAGSPSEPSRGFPITLDCPVEVDARWGHGKPPHPQLYPVVAAGDDRYRELLESFRKFLPQLRGFPIDGAPPAEPMWANSWFQGLDAAALYSLLALRDPERYVEVGSGWSTTFARRAIRDHGLRTHITSIDPQPRAEIDGLCDRVIREPLEKVDLSVFDSLQEGDVCFFDGSHYVLPNSDVTVAFLEVLPRLRPGVLVHVHDIFLPYDYIPFFYRRYYSEQYLLAAMLLAGGDRFEIVLPNFYVTQTPDLHQILQELWTDLISNGANVYGFSFWFTLRRPFSTQ